MNGSKVLCKKIGKI